MEQPYSLHTNESQHQPTQILIPTNNYILQFYKCSTSLSRNQFINKTSTSIIGFTLSSSIPNDPCIASFHQNQALGSMTTITGNLADPALQGNNVNILVLFVNGSCHNFIIHCKCLLVS